MKLKKWELALIIALGVTLLTGAGLVRQQRQLADRLIRLHVVANSDSAEDQTLKLTVRDAVQLELGPLLDGVSDREEAVRIVEDSIDSLTRAARDTVTNQGYDHNVNVTIGFESFPAREYKTFTLPAGRYLSLRVDLGESAGSNWWCVVFPPLCADSDVRASDALETLTDDQITLITEDGAGHVVRFRVLDWIERVRSVFG